MEWRTGGASDWYRGPNLLEQKFYKLFRTTENVYTGRHSSLNTLCSFITYFLSLKRNLYYIIMGGLIIHK